MGQGCVAAPLAPDTRDLCITCPLSRSPRLGLTPDILLSPKDTCAHGWVSGQAPSASPPSPQARVTAAHLMKPRNSSMIKLTSHPAVAKALGMVSAPVPTMRLNMYTSPTWSQEK